MRGTDNRGLHILPAMVRGRIEREIEIDAPVETVWAVVTDPDYLGCVRIETIEPPRALTVRRSPNAAAVLAGEETWVSFELEAIGRRTRLRVIESGFERLGPIAHNHRCVSSAVGLSWGTTPGPLVALVPARA